MSIEIYDDDGRRITNPATLRAIEESEQIIADWKRRRRAFDDGDSEENS